MKLQKLLAPALALTLLCGCGEAAVTEPTPALSAPEVIVTPETAAPPPVVTTEPVDTADLSETYPDAHFLELSTEQNADGTYSHTAVLDGETVEEFDYVWHADPSADHDEVKSCPAEYFTGTAPETDAAVYIAHDIFYYPELDESAFTRVNYDGDQEWAYYYTAEGYEDFIFATLPVQGSGVPTQMMHSEEDAYENAVLHITAAGTYVLTGTWHGQIWIDLGDTDDTFADESARVTVILGGADVTCTVAPALVFYSVYECDNTWEDQDSWSYEVDTSAAGANVILADGTVNNFIGTNVYRMLKAQYKSEDAVGTVAVPTQKKARKTDGAFYSYVSMNINGGTEGSGVLNVTGGFEGLDTELHLTIGGGNVNVYSQDDGVNVNEDGVSVVTVNGGSVHILAGLGSEGDGIDSNGFLVINGGTVISAANPNSDSGMDSDCGTYVNGGTVIALGSTMDWAESDGSENAGQAAMNLRFNEHQSADEAIIVTDTDGKIILAYDPDKDEAACSNARFYQGAIISAPGITVGGDYCIYVGGDVIGEEAAGVYDVSTVTGFSEGAKQQGYSGTGTFGGMDGGRGGMNGMGAWGERDDEFRKGGQTLPDDFDPAQMEAPEGFDRAQMQGIGPERPQGGDGEMPMEKPEGEGWLGDRDFGDRQDMTPPDGFGRETAAGELSTVFTMTAKVNGFSGVCDAEA